MVMSVFQGKAIPKRKLASKSYMQKICSNDGSKIPTWRGMELMVLFVGLEISVHAFSMSTNRPVGQ